jgi:hypothetical protein
MPPSNPHSVISGRGAERRSTASRGAPLAVQAAVALTTTLLWHTALLVLRPTLTRRLRRLHRGTLRDQHTAAAPPAWCAPCL